MESSLSFGGTVTSCAQSTTHLRWAILHGPPLLLGPLLEHALDCDAAGLATRWRQVETAMLGLPSDDAD